MRGALQREAPQFNCPNRAGGGSVNDLSKLLPSGSSSTFFSSTRSARTARTARTRMRLRRAVLASPAVAALFAFAQQPARASSFYWDADAQGTPGGGSGNWNINEPRWANSPSSTTYG